MHPAPNRTRIEPGDAAPSGPRLAVLAGCRSGNVGSAFFQRGAEWVLRRARPDAHVLLIADEPGDWNVRGSSPPEALDHVRHLAVDAIVLQGPIFRPEMRRIVEPVMRAPVERGGRVIILGAGMMQDDPATIAGARDMLEGIRPWILSTRDTETYEALGDLAEHAIDGVDVASFVSDLLPAVPADLPPHAVFDVDQIPEPRFVEAAGGSDGDGSREFEGRSWRPEQPRLRTEPACRRRAYLFGKAPRPRRRPTGRFDGRFAGRDVVRTDHRYNLFRPRENHDTERTSVGDMPHSDLNLDARSRLTPSHRMHACGATTSCGNPAMPSARSPRGHRLKRLGLDTIEERPIRIDMEFLRPEKQQFIAWLAERLAGLGPSTAPAEPSRGAAAEPRPTRVGEDSGS